jgi:hypothetical protein
MGIIFGAFMLALQADLVASKVHKAAWGALPFSRDELPLWSRFFTFKTHLIPCKVHEVAPETKINKLSRQIYNNVEQYKKTNMAFDGYCGQIQSPVFISVVAVSIFFGPSALHSRQCRFRAKFKKLQLPKWEDVRTGSFTRHNQASTVQHTHTHTPTHTHCGWGIKIITVK